MGSKTSKTLNITHVAIEKAFTHSSGSPVKKDARVKNTVSYAHYARQNIYQPKENNPPQNKKPH